MTIAVLNGSPKGEKSITMNYIKFLEKKNLKHKFKYFNVSQRITKLEKDQEYFKKEMAAINDADGVLWAFPLYYCLVSSQYKRFIELIFKRRAEHIFSGKYAAVFTTSIHFFDHTAHNYMEGICSDLGIKYAGGYSAGMRDLFDPEERKQIEYFGRNFITAIQKETAALNNYYPVEWKNFNYKEKDSELKIDQGNKKILVLTDSSNPDSNLSKMVRTFCSCFNKGIEIININELDMKGGCLGCLRCAYDNICSYDGSDGYAEFYRNKVMKADILIYAGTVRDRYLSSRWKMFFDRQFFKNHKPVFSGKQAAFIISGPLSQLSNLREILEAEIQMNMANCCGFVTDEAENSITIGEQLAGLAEKVTEASIAGYSKPRTFLGVGGMKIFRDQIYGHLRFPFKADYYYYKKNGLFDFPQKKRKERLLSSIFLFLTRFKGFREEVYKHRMKDEMVKPLKSLLKKI